VGYSASILCGPGQGLPVKSNGSFEKMIYWVYIKWILFDLLHFILNGGLVLMKLLDTKCVGENFTHLTNWALLCNTSVLIILNISNFIRDIQLQFAIQLISVFIMLTVGYTISFLCLVVFAPPGQFFDEMTSGACGGNYSIGTIIIGNYFMHHHQALFATVYVVCLVSLSNFSVFITQFYRSIPNKLTRWAIFCIQAYAGALYIFVPYLVTFDPHEVYKTYLPTWAILVCGLAIFLLTGLLFGAILIRLNVETQHYIGGPVFTEPPQIHESNVFLGDLLIKNFKYFID
jgi:hypothetical protein